MLLPLLDYFFDTYLISCVRVDLLEIIVSKGAHPCLRSTNKFKKGLLHTSAAITPLQLILKWKHHFKILWFLAKHFWRNILNTYPRLQNMLARFQGQMEGMHRYEMSNRWLELMKRGKQHYWAVPKRHLVRFQCCRLHHNKPFIWLKRAPLKTGA